MPFQEDLKVAWDEPLRGNSFRSLCVAEGLKVVKEGRDTVRSFFCRDELSTKQEEGEGNLSAFVESLGPWHFRDGILFKSSSLIDPGEPVELVSPPF